MISVSVCTPHRAYFMLARDDGMRDDAQDRCGHIFDPNTGHWENTSSQGRDMRAMTRVRDSVGAMRQCEGVRMVCAYAMKSGKPSSSCKANKTIRRQPLNSLRDQYFIHHLNQTPLYHHLPKVQIQSYAVLFALCCGGEGC